MTDITRKRFLSTVRALMHNEGRAEPERQTTPGATVWLLICNIGHNVERIVEYNVGHNVERVVEYNVGHNVGRCDRPHMEQQ